jgi:SAM-dependent methyltransferase
MTSTFRIMTSIAKNLAVATPPGRAIHTRRRHEQSFGEGGVNAASYPMSVFRRHISAVSAVRAGGARGADVLEIGPGGNVGVGLLMLLAGAASVTCIDSAPWIRDVASDQLHTAIIELAQQDADEYHVAEEFREAARCGARSVARELVNHITYLQPVDIASTTLPTASMDIIFSQACFEHFADPQGALDQISRLLRPRGVTSHQIDLRDHRDYDRPFEFLQYSDIVWRLASSQSPLFVRNRWRVPDYRRGFQRAGLETLRIDATERSPLSAEMRKRLHSRIRAMNTDEVEIIGVQIVARKPIEQG